MKLTRFLASKSITLCALAIFLLLWCLFAALSKTSVLVIGITVAAAVAIILISIAVEYFFVAKRLKKLERICLELPDGYLLGEVIPKPVNALEEEYYRIMKFISRSALTKTEDTERAKLEYCDYIEKWIHEIKTPLTACSLIIANGGDMRKLKTQLKRAENLTENVLYYARLRTIEADTQITKVSVHSVIDCAIKSQTELLLQSGASVEVTGDFTVNTDGKALEFILKQLLVNCAKYCPDCRIIISADDGKITVEDNGEGIPSHEIPRIFSRGFVGSAGRKRGGGTGMGLYLVHELCSNLNIEITTQSEVGKFTRFILDFKL